VTRNLKNFAKFLETKQGQLSRLPIVRKIERVSISGEAVGAEDVNMFIFVSVYIEIFLIEFVYRDLVSLPDEIDGQ